MAPNTIVTAQPIGVRQPEPPEGRKAYPLTMPQINFVTGNEVFEWDSNKLGNAEPSAIMGAWIDASQMSGLAATDGIVIVFNPNSANSQRIFVQAGTQGYAVVIQQKPVQILISSAGGSTGVAQVILYNYNPLFTGSIATNAQSLGAGAPSGGGNSGNVTPGGHNAPHITHQL